MVIGSGSGMRNIVDGFILREDNNTDETLNLTVSCGLQNEHYCPDISPNSLLKISRFNGHKKAKPIIP
jgi:hypothetical protein